jgi:large subunit ribosomal protein L18
MAIDKKKARIKRHRRIRKSISGTAARPRLCINKSLKHMEGQLIDDVAGKTLLGLSTSSKEVKGRVKSGNKVGARILGEILAEKALALKISAVVFDRGGFLYHGCVQEFAESAREKGLKF